MWIYKYFLQLYNSHVSLFNTKNHEYVLNRTITSFIDSQTDYKQESQTIDSLVSGDNRQIWTKNKLYVASFVNKQTTTTQFNKLKDN